MDDRPPQRAQTIAERIIHAITAPRAPGDAEAAKRYQWAKWWLNSRFFPRALERPVPDPQLRLVFRERIIGAYAPPIPLLSRDAQVASIGSCFAEEISKSLRDQGLKTAHVTMSERWNTPLTLRLFLQRYLSNTPFPDGFLPPDIDLTATEQEAVTGFGDADLFILTFGLSMSWFIRASGQLVLEAPQSHSLGGMGLALKEHEMRQLGVPECEQSILDCINEIRAFRPAAAIVLTLSPVPLLGALTDTPVISANTISKSVLRVALHNVMGRSIDSVYYWPSYECVTWAGSHVELAYGGDDRDQRHIRPDLIAAIAEEFKRSYFFDSVAPQ